MGGTWELTAINRTIVGAGDKYALGDVGGEETVKLDFPNYQFKVWSPENPTSPNVNSTFQGNVGYYGIKTNYSTNYNTPHNNMMPYVAYYIWKRIA